MGVIKQQNNFKATLKKLQDSCKYLYNLPANIERNKKQYERKVTTSRHGSEITAKLVSKLGKPIVLSSAGLSLVDDSTIKAGKWQTISKDGKVIKNLNAATLD